MSYEVEFLHFFNIEPVVFKEDTFRTPDQRGSICEGEGLLCAVVGSPTCASGAPHVSCFFPECGFVSSAHSKIGVNKTAYDHLCSSLPGEEKIGGGVRRRSKLPKCVFKSMFLVLKG